VDMSVQERGLSITIKILIYLDDDYFHSTAVVGIKMDRSYLSARIVTSIRQMEGYFLGQHAQFH
jgi:hypothetical protein